MSSGRIQEFIALDAKELAALFAPFDSAAIREFSLIEDSFSNSGYAVATGAGKYLLKAYNNTTDPVETASYRFLKDKIPVPALYYYDGSKRLFPFAYAIMEFLEGATFINHVRTGRSYPLKMVCAIGRMCAEIHKRTYPYDALLDGGLNPAEKQLGAREKMLQLCAGKPAAHLRSETIDRLRAFIDDNPDLFDRIEAGSVLCHGDFGHNNIMVSRGRTYCIDFEFACAGSMYDDIGRFFRRKDDDVQALVDGSVYDSFARGYDSVSARPLPPDWLRLARLCDINALLRLLSYDRVPAEWIADIEHDILYAIRAHEG